MTSYSEEIDTYNFDDNPAHDRTVDIADIQREQAENLRKAIGDELWDWLETHHSK